MNIPIILTAFSTTPAAQTTHKKIEKSVKNNFPNRKVYWGYNSRSVARASCDDNQNDIRHPTDILKQLAQDGYHQAIVQSLHLLPGHEFHCLHQEVRQVTAIDCQIGMPLLSSPLDYQTVLDMLTPIIMHDQQQAVLLVGHGTRHPIWPAYIALETLLQKRFGLRVFVGVLEHYPVTADVEERIRDAGYHNVLLLPFFLVTGIHYRRDMIGPDEHSWRNRLERRGLKVEPVPEGIGMLPGIGELVTRHIEEAENILLKKKGV